MQAQTCLNRITQVSIKAKASWLPTCVLTILADALMQCWMSSGPKVCPQANVRSEKLKILKLVPIQTKCYSTAVARVMEKAGKRWQIRLGCRCKFPFQVRCGWSCRQERLRSMHGPLHCLCLRRSHHRLFPGWLQLSSSGAPWLYHCPIKTIFIATGKIF